MNHQKTKLSKLNTTTSRRDRNVVGIAFMHNTRPVGTEYFYSGMGFIFYNSSTKIASLTGRASFAIKIIHHIGKVSFNPFKHESPEIN